MSFYDQNRPFGTPVGVPEAPPVEGLSWTEAAYHMRIHGSNFHPPAQMRGMSLAQIEAKAREETREAREAQEAKESAARIENAPKSIERALLDGPSSSKQATPAQRGWRLRVRYANQLRRCSTLREAAARVGVDESTARRGAGVSNIRPSASAATTSSRSATGRMPTISNCGPASRGRGRTSFAASRSASK